MRNYGVWALCDLVAVVVFCAIGRANHAEAASLSGLATTAWPFLAGLGAGWAGVWALKADARDLIPGGLTVWLSTLVFGMILRVVSGQGTAVSFIVVAGIALAILLLGWRGIRAVVSARAAP